MGKFLNVIKYEQNLEISLGQVKHRKSSLYLFIYFVMFFKLNVNIINPHPLPSSAILLEIPFGIHWPTLRRNILRVFSARVPSLLPNCAYAALAFRSDTNCAQTKHKVCLTQATHTVAHLIHFQDAQSARVKEAPQAKRTRCQKSLKLNICQLQTASRKRTKVKYKIRHHSKLKMKKKVTGFWSPI